MRMRLEEINKTVFSPRRGPASPLGCEVAVQKYGGFWGPFIGIPGVAPAPTPPPHPLGKCLAEMSTLCPLGNFSTYNGCRGCLKAVETNPERKAELAGCIPAAPDKFYCYCGQRWPPPPNPSIKCAGGDT